MIVDFSKIPDEGKIWIFPSSRKFYPQEIEELIEGIGISFQLGQVIILILIAHLS